MTTDVTPHLRPCPDDCFDMPNYMLNLLHVLNPQEYVLLTYLMLSRKANRKTSRNHISRRLNVSLASVTRCLSKLQTLGFISKELHRDDALCLPSTYVLNDEATQAAAQAWE